MRAVPAAGWTSLEQAVPDQTRSFTTFKWNVWFRPKPPCRFRDRASPQLLTGDGWLSLTAARPFRSMLQSRSRTFAPALVLPTHGCSPGHSRNSAENTAGADACMITQEGTRHRPR